VSKICTSQRKGVGTISVIDWRPHVKGIDVSQTDVKKSYQYQQEISKIYSPQTTVSSVYAPQLSVVTDSPFGYAGTKYAGGATSPQLVPQVYQYPTAGTEQKGGSGLNMNLILVAAAALGVLYILSPTSKIPTPGGKKDE